MSQDSQGNPVDPAVERRANRMWLIVLAVIAALLVVRAGVGTKVGSGASERTVHGFGMVYVESKDGAEVRAPASAWAEAVAKDPDQATVWVSWSRTVGTWVAALATLAVLSFLWRDNPLYKLAESVVVGVSAGYVFTVAVWQSLVNPVIGNLAPGWTKAALSPGLTVDPADPSRWLALVPVALGMLLLCRLSARLSWLGTFPLAFVVGVFSGWRFVQYVESDLLAQVATMFTPLHDPSLAGFDAFAGTLKAVLVLVGVLSVLTYFFFSVEHRGAVGGTARLGIWYLMVTFGASFGLTVMGRIALLAGRFEFLFDDWLWLIDPYVLH
jgi:hypothetical protein